MVAMRNALIDPADGVVLKLANQAIFGVSLYTGTGSGPPTCPTLTSEPRAPNNLNAIRTLLQAATPKSNTPTAASIDAVVAKFTSNPAPAGSPKIIVLATDGLPDTCQDQNPPENDPNDPRRLAANLTAVQAAQRAFNAGIKLFFLFIGPAVAGDHAQQMANAGAGQDPASGRAQFFIATNPTELTQAFSTIIGGVVSCDLKLDTALDPNDAPDGSVTIDGRKLNYPSEWNLDPDGITIHILGNACMMLKAATNPVVDAAFPCGSVIE
jgi:cyclophilin family peptidyl-prolyl cis-trans isomerase